MTAGLCNIFCTGKKGQIFEAANLLADDFDEALHVEAVNESLNGLISPVMTLDCLPNVGDDNGFACCPDNLHYFEFCSGYVFDNHSLYLTYIVFTGYILLCPAKNCNTAFKNF